MPTFEPVPVDDPRSVGMLTAYFASREIGFAHQHKTYSPTTPDAEAFTPPSGTFLVVVDAEGNDVGCGGVRRVADGVRGPRYEVKHLYLDPSTRRRGWGRDLLAELEARAKGWGATELVLDTHHSLEAAAALYRGAGFVETERFNDNPNASRWYAKVLAEG